MSGHTPLKICDGHPDRCAKRDRFRPPSAEKAKSAFSAEYNRGKFLGGYTLIEIVAYIAILVVLTAVAVNTLLLVQRSLAEIRVTRALNAAAAVAAERMVRVIRDAAAVNTGSSILDNSPGVLSLTGSEATPLTHRFSVANFQLLYERGANPAITLTPPGVLVSAVIFRATSTPVSRAVRVELTLEASSGRDTSAMNFYSTAVLRGSYSQ